MSENSADTSTTPYDHEGLRTIAAFAWGNIYNKFRGNETQIAQAVRELTTCWTSDDVINVLQKYHLDPEDWGFEVPNKVVVIPTVSFQNPFRR